MMLLKENYFLLSYGIALCIGIATYRKYYDTILKYLPILIAYTFLNELLGYLIRYYPNFSFFQDYIKTSQNDIIYNLYDLVYFGYFYYVYWKLNTRLKIKKWIQIAAFTALFSYIISIFFQNPLEISLYYATSYSSWILVFCILLYFYDIYLNKEKFIQPGNLMHWVSLGLLIFYNVFPIIFLIGYLDYNIWSNYNLSTVLRILIVIMYSIFTIGFIKARKREFR